MRERKATKKIGQRWRLAGMEVRSDWAI